MSEEPRRSFGPRDPGWLPYRLGRSALADAKELSASAETRGSALLLYRSAAVLLLRARVLDLEAEARGEDAPESGSPDETEAKRAAVLGELGEGRSFFDRFAGPDGELRLAELARGEHTRVLEGLRAIGDLLVKPLRNRARRRLSHRTVVRLRLGVAAAVAASLLAFLVAKLLAPPNLALYKPVTVTSRSPDWGCDPAQVVDGDRTDLGFHTESWADQHVTIDLGKIQPIREVVVFNRYDCCAERTPPMELLVSEDNQNYRQVATADRPFERWSARLNGMKARYVRLLHRAATPFHLSEIEVY